MRVTTTKFVFQLLFVFVLQMSFPKLFLGFSSGKVVICFLDRETLGINLPLWCTSPWHSFYQLFIVHRFLTLLVIYLVFLPKRSQSQNLSLNFLVFFNNSRTLRQIEAKISHVLFIFIPRQENKILIKSFISHLRDKHH